MMPEYEQPIILKLYYDNSNTVAMPSIPDIATVLDVIANIKKAMSDGTVYTLNYDNCMWVVNGAHIVTFEAQHPRMRELLTEWQKQNSPRLVRRRPIRWVRQR